LRLLDQEREQVAAHYAQVFFRLAIEQAATLHAPRYGPRTPAIRG